ncbi:hypothetical protein KJ840_00765 [Patescibacteria group bacterium]|nr:hypothetical protein [Patescibacteria group bacterium]
MFDQNQSISSNKTNPTTSDDVDKKTPVQSMPPSLDDTAGFKSTTFNNQKPAGQPSATARPAGTMPGTEDIFAETDKMAQPPSEKPPLAPKMPARPTPAGPPEPLTKLPDDVEEEKSGGKRFLALGLAVAVVAVVGYGGYIFYGKFFASNDFKVPQLNLNQIDPEVLNQDTNNDIINVNSSQNINQVPVNQPAPEAAEKAITLDSDKDGLTDLEEETYGTDPAEPDSDGDGLFDKEEVKVYKTNPLDPDSDQDGYLDGAEVTAGYNPDGPGKLLEANFE